MAISAKNPYFRPPGGSKRGENEFFGKKRKRHVLTFPKTKLHAKNQKILSRGFPGKQGKRDRQKDRQTERDVPEFKGPPDAIAKPLDQKELRLCGETLLYELYLFVDPKIWLTPSP